MPVPRKAWLNNRFQQMDLDEDGYISERDFLETVYEAARELGRPLDAIQVRQAEEHIRRTWIDMAAFDTDGDGRLSRKEFIAAFAEDSAGFSETFKRASDVFFDLGDVDGDGMVDAEEFAKLMRGFRVPPRVIASVFSAMDTNGDNKISRQEYTESWVTIYAK